MPTNSRNHETIVLHSGYRSDPTTTAVALPIYQTTSYQFSSTEHGGNLFALKELGNIYSRIMNATQAVLEERVAASKVAWQRSRLLRDRRPRCLRCRTSVTPATIPSARPISVAAPGTCSKTRWARWESNAASLPPIRKTFAARPTHVHACWKHFVGAGCLRRGATEPHR